MTEMNVLSPDKPSGKKWVKASWIENKKVLSEAIPRTWVSRSLYTVWWPPKGTNYKAAIQMCRPPTDPKEGWFSFKLRWCSRGVDTLDEAQGIETEAGQRSSDDLGEDEHENCGDLDSNTKEQSLGRGSRQKRKPRDLADYVSQTPDVGTTDDTGGPRMSGKEGGDAVVCTLPGVVGDQSGSHQVLEKIMSEHITSRQGQLPDVSSSLRTDMQSEKIAEAIPFETVEKVVGDKSDLVQIKRLISQAAAESKVRHDEVMHKLGVLEKRTERIEKALFSRRSLGETETVQGDMEFSDCEDEQCQFAMSLPCQSFEDFELLEEELGANHGKRRALKTMLRNLGGRDANDILSRGISSVIQRPQLAQNFNCGGQTKDGKIVGVKEKRNFMGTHTQKILLRIMFYMIGRELFSSQSPSGIFGDALKKCEKSDQLIGMLGEPMKGYGETTRRGRRRHVSHQEFEMGGVMHLRMRFYVEGPRGKATVTAEMKKNDRGNYEYRYIVAEMDGYPRRSVLVVDNT